jgi:hypothetical protein
MNDDEVDPDDGSNEPDGWLAMLQRNRAFTALFAICIVGGALAGAAYLPEDFSLVRRLLGGAVSGGGIAFLMTATKML